MAGDVAVVHPAPGGVRGRTWGDTHFAEALAAALGRRGVFAEVHSRYTWDEAQACDAVVVLRGLRRYDPGPHDRSVLWVISHPSLVDDEELAAYDHVCVASSLAAEEYRSRTATPVHVLHQATDITRFRPPGVGPIATADGVIVVANHRWPARRGPRWLRQLGVPFSLYGAGWEGTPEERFVVASFVPNRALPGLYASADVVVADQWSQMGHQGFVANRLFDVAAAGGFVLADDGPGLAEVFGDLVPTYTTRAELGDQIGRWIGDPAARRHRVTAAMELVRDAHHFDHRAGRLLSLLAT